MSYATIYFNNRSRELTSILTFECINMMERYTFLRRNLISRDEQLMMAARRNILQENTIQELRLFIEEHIQPAFEFIDKIYNTNLKNGYVTVNKDDKINKLNQQISLSLYQSTVLRMQSDTQLYKFKSKIDELTTEVEYLNGFNEALEMKASIYLQYE